MARAHFVARLGFGLVGTPGGVPRELCAALAHLRHRIVCAVLAHPLRLGDRIAELHELDAQWRYAVVGERPLSTPPARVPFLVPRTFAALATADAAIDLALACVEDPRD